MPAEIDEKALAAALDAYTAAARKPWRDAVLSIILAYEAAKPAPAGAVAWSEMKAREAAVMQDFAWGNLTPLGVANHLRRAGFKSEYAQEVANRLAHPAPASALEAFVSDIRSCLTPSPKGRDGKAADIVWRVYSEAEPERGCDEAHKEWRAAGDLVKRIAAAFAGRDGKEVGDLRQMIRDLPDDFVDDGNCCAGGATGNVAGAARELRARHDDALRARRTRL